MMVIKPMNRESLADAIVGHLRAAILRGELAPGDELPGERILSQQLEANRGAVREALKRLMQVGLIEIHHGAATRVLDFRATATLDILPQALRRSENEIDLEVARSVIELRAVITPDMTRLAALRGSPEVHTVLRIILREMENEAIDDAKLQTLTDEFWVIIARNSGNLAYRLILNTVTEVRRVSEEILAVRLSAQYRDFSHLKRIVDAIEQRDAEAAFEAARERSQMMASKLTSGGASRQS